MDLPHAVNRPPSPPPSFARAPGPGVANCPTPPWHQPWVCRRHPYGFRPESPLIHCSRRLSFPVAAPNLSDFPTRDTTLIVDLRPVHENNSYSNWRLVESPFRSFRSLNKWTLPLSPPIEFNENRASIQAFFSSRLP